MIARAQLWIVAAAIVSLGAGAALSHVVDPGVRVEKVMLATNTPALRLFPAAAGSHPIALLAHGNGGSKEMLFRFGEALAAAGFDCYSVDQAGYGESPTPWSLTNILLHFQESTRALGAVDVFIGHSMGGGVGAWNVRQAGFRPKLFIGAVVTGILSLGCLALQFVSGENSTVWLFATLMCTFVISTLLLLPAVAVGRIATRGGSRCDGDVAMAIFASYVIGQFMPLF